MNKLGKILITLGVLFILFTALMFLVSFIYDSMVHPHDMNLPGLLAVASLFYLCPLGIVFIVIGIFLVGIFE